MSAGCACAAPAEARAQARTPSAQATRSTALTAAAACSSVSMNMSLRPAACGGRPSPACSRSSRRTPATSSGDVLGDVAAVEPEHVGLDRHRLAALGPQHHLARRTPASRGGRARSRNRPAPCLRCRSSRRSRRRRRRPARASAAAKAAHARMFGSGAHVCLRVSMPISSANRRAAEQSRRYQRQKNLSA